MQKNLTELKLLTIIGSISEHLSSIPQFEDTVVKAFLTQEALLEVESKIHESLLNENALLKATIQSMQKEIDALKNNSNNSTPTNPNENSCSTNNSGTYDHLKSSFSSNSTKSFVHAVPNMFNNNNNNASPQKRVVI
jgi:hypothetical protein